MKTLGFLQLISKAKKWYEKNKPAQSIKIPLKSGSIIHVIDTRDIIFIEKASKKTIIYTVKEEIEVYETLNHLIELLPAHFMRSHQSFIINTQKVKALKPYNPVSYEVEFNDTDKAALMLRSRYEDFRSILNKT